jgi:hypothetical protein
VTLRVALDAAADMEAIPHDAEQPYPTRNYLQTYGGLLLHCGFTTMGVPSSQDTHPLHGELPNAPYQKAWLAVGEDDKGPYIALRGEYEHMVFFNHHYVAHPEVRLRAGSTLIDVSITITNCKGADMELMYLAHANFRPVDNGCLIYSAPCDPQHVRVRRSIPSHVHPGPGYAEFQTALAENPGLHIVLLPGLAFDPEILFTLDYEHDAEGWCHSMQVHPDGSADYIAHRPDQLPFGLRWISRTPEHDSLGIVLPATAEAEGYLAERQKGNIRILPSNAQARFDMTLGYLSPAEATSMSDQIAAILRT